MGASWQLVQKARCVLARAELAEKAGAVNPHKTNARIEFIALLFHESNEIAKISFSAQNLFCRSLVRIMVIYTAPKPAGVLQLNLFYPLLTAVGGNFLRLTESG